MCKKPKRLRVLAFQAKFERSLPKGSCSTGYRSCSSGGKLKSTTRKFDHGQLFDQLVNVDQYPFLIRKRYHFCRRSNAVKRPLTNCLPGKKTALTYYSHQFDSCAQFLSSFAMELFHGPFVPIPAAPLTAMVNWHSA